MNDNTNNSSIDGQNSLLKKLGLKNLSNNIKESGSITDFSKNITSNFVKNIQVKKNEVVNNMKKVKLRALESKLKLEKTDMINSSKKSYIYQSNDKTVIIDKDMWNEPNFVTIKTSNNIITKIVKFLNDEPFLYPYFSEKAIFGRIIHLEEKELWFHDNGIVTIVAFRANDKLETIKVRTNTPKDYSNKNLMEDPKLFAYIKNYSIASTDNQLRDFLDSQNILINDIVRIGNTYVIVKLQNNQYKIILLKYKYVILEEFTLRKLPFTSQIGLDFLFSPDIVSYIKSNNYDFENFVINDNHLEYWNQLGDKKVCLIRCKLS